MSPHTRPTVSTPFSADWAQRAEVCFEFRLERRHSGSRDFLAQDIKMTYRHADHYLKIEMIELGVTLLAPAWQKRRDSKEAHT